MRDELSFVRFLLKIYLNSLEENERDEKIESFLERSNKNDFMIYEEDDFIKEGFELLDVATKKIILETEEMISSLEEEYKGRYFLPHLIDVPPFSIN